MPSVLSAEDILNYKFIMTCFSIAVQKKRLVCSNVSQHGSANFVVCFLADHNPLRWGKTGTKK